MNLNKVLLIGRLTRDPDLRTTANGTAVCEFGLAVNRRWRDQSGRDNDETTFVDITAWNRTAQNCAQFLQKGAPVLVEGRLHLEQWEDRNGGGKRSKLGVVADVVQFLGGRHDPEDSGAAGQAGNSRQSGRNNGGFGVPPQQPRYSPHDIPGYDPDDDIDDLIPF